MMSANEFNAAVHAAKEAGGRLDPLTASQCLSDLAELFQECDRRLDGVLDLLPKEVKSEIDGQEMFDTFSAYRELRVLSATCRGIADSSEPDIPAPFPAYQKAEIAAWRRAYANGRKLVEA